MRNGRRNLITRRDAMVVGGIAGLAALAAALAGCEPTGNRFADAFLTAGVAAFVTWASASAPWWALLVAPGVALAVALGGPVLVVLSAVVALGGAMWIAWQRANQPWMRAAIGGLTVQVLLRADWNPFLGASALIAGAVLVLLAVTGVLRRQRHVRRRVYACAGAFGLVGLLAVAGFAFTGVQARSSATSGYDDLLEGLELLQDGDLPAAATALRDASADLRSASDDISGVLGRGAAAVPVVAQNREVMVDLLDEAATTASAAASTLDVVDVDQLKIVDGVIDTEAVAFLAAPLADLEATALELQSVLHGAESPWLVDALQSRLETATKRVDQVVVQATAASTAADVGPALLGQDGPRRYLIAFTNPAEARGQTGLMGNWTELTIDDGRLSVTATGRTNDLQEGIRANEPVLIDMPEDWFERYAVYGAGSDGEGVREKFWSNVTMSPDMPSVGAAMAQMYEGATGRSLDGVFVMDPAAIAALLDITGPITVEGVGELNSGNAERFLLLDQYQLAENEREDFLASVTAQTVDKVLDSTLPAPQELAERLGVVALDGHLSAYATRPEEQALFREIGMEAAMPAAADERDTLAVVTNNASGNKIDSFLERSVDYRPVFDPRTGGVDADLSITLDNMAPTTGYPDYVIGNLVDAPAGTNRTMLSVYSPLHFDSMTVDGEPVDMQIESELGLNVATVFFNVDSGSSAVVDVSMSGNRAAHTYALAYRPQPLPVPDDVTIEATTTGGDTILRHSGPLGRRTLLTADDVRAWR
jgi:Protein of unknown function (DUF4012)